MTEKTPRADRRGRRRGELVALASSRLMERGYDGTSVNDLAADAGMSVGGMYRYIKTKSDLLVLACEDIYGNLRDQIVDVSLGPGDLPEKIAEAIRVYLESCWNNRDQILLMYREYRHLPADAQGRYKQRERDIVSAFADLIGAAVRQGRTDPGIEPFLVAEDIVFLGHMPALKRWALPPSLHGANLIERQVSTIMRTLALTPPAASAGDEVDHGRSSA